MVRVLSCGIEQVFSRDQRCNLFGSRNSPAWPFVQTIYILFKLTWVLGCSLVVSGWEVFHSIRDFHFTLFPTYHLFVALGSLFNSALYRQTFLLRMLKVPLFVLKSLSSHKSNLSTMGKSQLDKQDRDRLLGSATLGGYKTKHFIIRMKTHIQKLFRYMNTMEELVNIVLAHSSKMTSMNEPASTPPLLLIIDKLALASTSKDEPDLPICMHQLNSLLTSHHTAKNT